MLKMGLVAGWRFQEPTGIRSDVLGITPLSEVGGAIVSADSKFGRAVSFANGATLGAAVSPVRSGSFTLSCWVNHTTGGAATGFVMALSINSGADPLMFIALTGAAGNKSPRYSVNVAPFNEGVPTPGRWMHLVSSYNSALPGFSTFQNGLRTGIHLGAADFTDVNSLCFGSAVLALVDEAYVWNRALNEAEVARLYASGNSGMTYPFTDGYSFQ